MANWLNQLQSLLGQSRSSTSSSADQGLGKLLVPGALGGLAGLLVVLIHLKYEKNRDDIGLFGI